MSLSPRSTVPFVARPRSRAAGTATARRTGYVADGIGGDTLADAAPALEPRIDVRSGPGVADETSGSEESTVLDWSVFGPLAPYVAGEGVTDVFVNGEAGLWVDAGSGAVREDAWHCDERTLRVLAVRLVALGGRHVDEASPCVDVRLAEGIRVHVVLPPISTGGTLISIRVPRRVRFSLDELAAVNMLGEFRGRLEAAIRDRANLLVTGAAGSGKTTLLSALLATAPAQERIVCVEDVAELQVTHPHVVALEARQANLEGAGAVGLDRLVREALRMRPDRLVVGECRGAEVRDLMAALNTGHDGGAGTLHANSMDDVPARLEALGALAGMDASAVARQAVSAFDLVVHLERVGSRRVVACCAELVVDAAGRLLAREAA
ncbi:TadA family conjugal transfer-associated ATPase [Humibacter albus]|uniref:TadA family conjugal transfer-associated ATPase n=1 Tax=Humibacter albus TaxID=427754 RepID=UPI00068846E5|nr:TadA family conjugal transfer-associated ATPase [Humibacter albus]